jgi:hydrogenase nickel incorporation protein HypA/HybF
MHEIRIAKDLTAIVLEVASREKLSKVTKVNISFGQMIQIVPDVFAFAFREIVRDTIAMEAVINIEILPVKMKCSICKNEIMIDDNSFSCTSCGSTELDMIQGNELFIKSIEGE